MSIVILGIDLGKNVCSVVARLDQQIADRRIHCCAGTAHGLFRGLNMAEQLLCGRSEIGRSLELSIDRRPPSGPV